MTRTMLKKRTHLDMVINIFSSKIQIKAMKYIKELLTEKYSLVLSLIIIYHNSKMVVYKVVGSVIYSYVGNFICLGYQFILQENLSSYDNKLKRN